MTPAEISLNTKLDQSAANIVKFMALPTADPKIKNQLARYVKGQLLAVIVSTTKDDMKAIEGVIKDHFKVS